MATDYHAEAREIARLLDLESLNGEAQSLRDAIDAGSTGSEILMALRWRLEHIDGSNLRMNPETRGRIRRLLTEIGSTLEGCGPPGGDDST
jgi:hypothetical protein